MANISIDAALGGVASLGANARVAFRAGAFLTGASACNASPTVVVGYPAPVRTQTTTRVVHSGLLVFEQVDLFLPDGKTRVQGVTAADVRVKVHVGSTDLAWPVVSGTSVADVQAAAGKVYWEEFEAGFYSVRFFPNRIGLWRLIVTWPAGNQAVSQMYDVIPKPAFPGALGLRATFTK